MAKIIKIEMSLHYIQQVSHIRNFQKIKLKFVCQEYFVVNIRYINNLIFSYSIFL